MIFEKDSVIAVFTAELIFSLNIEFKFAKHSRAFDISEAVIISSVDIEGSNNSYGFICKALANFAKVSGVPHRRPPSKSHMYPKDKFAFSASFNWLKFARILALLRFDEKSFCNSSEFINYNIYAICIFDTLHIAVL